MKLSYITLTWNHQQFIKNWIVTLKKYMPKDVEHEIIVVDNGSTDDTINIVKSFSDIKLILNKENVGEGKGFNIAMKEAKGEHIFKSDPDVYFTGPFYDKMIEYFKYPEVGVVVGHNPGWEELIRDKYDEKGKIIGKMPYTEQYLIAGAFFCLSRRTLDEVGYWEPSLPYGGSELDYTARVRMKKYKVVRAFVPDGGSTNIKHCGRFQTGPEKTKIPEKFNKISDDAWWALYVGGRSTCYWYMLSDWLVRGDLWRLDRKRDDYKGKKVDLDKFEGYLGNWGRD